MSRNKAAIHLLKLVATITREVGSVPMNPADEMAAKVGPNERHLADEKSDPQLRAILGNLERVGRGNSLEQDDLHSGKRRRSRGFARFLLAICIGVAATLAWQSYGDAAKQIIAIRAPDLGWSPGTKQMIASWMQQLGWRKPPAGSEEQAKHVAQTAPAAPAIDPAQVQQMVQSLATVREAVQELAAGQSQVTREIDKLESVVAEILEKMPEPPPQPPAAPARKPTPAPPSSRTPIPPRPAPHP
jgi:hypothetical protein